MREVVQPPFVLDDPEDPRERFPFVTCQEEDHGGISALRIHAREDEALRAAVGGGSVNGRGTFGSARERAGDGQPPPGVLDASTVPPADDDDVLDDREPEARAPRRARAVGAVEALEEPRQVLAATPGAVVGAAITTPGAVAPDGEREVAPSPA